VRELALSFCFRHLAHAWATRGPEMAVVGAGVAQSSSMTVVAGTLESTAEE
jgi:hypothetical protein